MYFSVITQWGVPADAIAKEWGEKLEKARCYKVKTVYSFQRKTLMG